MSLRRGALALSSRLVARPALLRAALHPPQLAAWAVGQRRCLCASTVDVPIPELGAESIVEGGIYSLAKGVGDYVAAEEMVAEIETDKVTIEAKSPHAGTIKAIHVEVGQTVEVGKPFFSIAVGVGEATAAPAAAAAAPAAAAAAPAATPAVVAAVAAAGRVHPSGKRSLISFPPRGAAAMAAQTAAKLAAASAGKVASAKPVHAPPPPGTIAQADLPLRFQRKAVTEEEMDAVMMGGAGYEGSWKFTNRRSMYVGK